METLKQKAEARRLEVKAQEESRSVNENDRETDFLYALDRPSVKLRAKAIIEYTWRVLPNHKVERSGYESYIDIPYYVANAANYSYVTGIPYCWGGDYGLDGATYSGYSFSSAVILTNKTAGNTKSNYYAPAGSTSYEVPGTIGVDCVGFLRSAYNMSGEKMKSKCYMSVGEEVDLEDLKPMDILAKDGHVMIFVGMSGSDADIANQVKQNVIFITYEAYVDGIATGKACINTTRTWANVESGGYVGRNLFCTVCNDSGKEAISSTHHANSCTVCGYCWPNTEAEHSLAYVGGVYECSICYYNSAEFED